MKIAILGGAFDPPHLGHQIVAQELLQQLKLDEVWLMPVYSHPLNKTLTAANHRLAMTRLLATDKVKVSDFEIAKADTSYTIETLQVLTAKHPEHSFSWCIGTDMLTDFHQWKDWQQLITKYSFIIYPRGFGIRDIEPRVEEIFQFSPLPDRITVIDQANIAISNISSTLIRNKLKAGQSVSHLVPQSVIRYIQLHHLYES